LVKICKNSWKKYAGKKLITLDKGELKNYLSQDKISPLFKRHVHVQMRADLIRLKLLLRYGGVWADATVFCSEDYHNWLSKDISPFPVWRPGTSRLISNWLIFSSPGNKILESIYKHLYDIVIRKKYKVWSGNDSKMLNNFRKWARSYFKRAYRVHGASEYAEAFGLFSRIKLITLFRGYPYLIFHYTFAYINWKSGDKKDGKNNMSGKDAHILQRYLAKTKNPIDEKILIILKNSPIHKLAHNMEIKKNILDLLENL
jgi:hypothetical protein